MNEDLLKILACPICKGNLIYDKTASMLICKKCRKKFKIKEGIPILLPNAAVA